MRLSYFLRSFLQEEPRDELGRVQVHLVDGVHPPDVGTGHRVGLPPAGCVVLEEEVLHECDEEEGRCVREPHSGPGTVSEWEAGLRAELKCSS